MQLGWGLIDHISQEGPYGLCPGSVSHARSIFDDMPKLKVPVQTTREIEYPGCVRVIAAEWDSELIVTEALPGASLDTYARACCEIAEATDCDVVMRHNGRRMIAQPDADPLVLGSQFNDVRMR